MRVSSCVIYQAIDKVNQYRQSGANKNILQVNSSVPEMQYQMKNKESEKKKNKDQGRIENERLYKLSFQQKHKSPLNPAARTFYSKCSKEEAG